MLFLPVPVHCSSYLWTGYTRQRLFRGFSALSDCASPLFRLSMDWLHRGTARSATLPSRCLSLARLPASPYRTPPSHMSWINWRSRGSLGLGACKLAVCHGRWTGPQWAPDTSYRALSPWQPGAWRRWRRPGHG